MEEIRKGSIVLKKEEDDSTYVRDWENFGSFKKEVLERLKRLENRVFKAGDKDAK